MNSGHIHTVPFGTALYQEVACQECGAAVFLGDCTYCLGYFLGGQPTILSGVERKRKG